MRWSNVSEAAAINLVVGPKDSVDVDLVGSAGRVAGVAIAAGNHAWLGHYRQIDTIAMIIRLSSRCCKGDYLTQWDLHIVPSPIIYAVTLASGKLHKYLNLRPERIASMSISTEFHDA